MQKHIYNERDEIVPLSGGIMLLSNKNIKGEPIFCENERIKQRSLKIYTYLVCISHLKDSYSGTRIFQQREINLSAIKRLFKMDERTIKKYWEQLEMDGLIQFNGRYHENYDTTFAERWKVRNKNKESYYSIPCPTPYRKIPKETLKELNEELNVDELTLKIYLILLNYQEICILTGKNKKAFTYTDLRDILGYSSHHDTNKKLEAALLQLESLNLISIKTDKMLNKYGVSIPVFILEEVRFYIDYDIKDYEPSVESVIEDKIKEQIIEMCEGDEK